MSSAEGLVIFQTRQALSVNVAGRGTGLLFGMDFRPNLTGKNGEPFRGIA